MRSTVAGGKAGLPLNKLVGAKRRVFAVVTALYVVADKECDSARTVVGTIAVVPYPATELRERHHRDSIKPCRIQDFEESGDRIVEFLHSGGVLSGLEFAGITLDADKNEATRGEGRIDAADSSAAIWVLETNEELIVARQAVELLGA